MAVISLTADHDVPVGGAGPATVTVEAGSRVNYSHDHTSGAAGWIEAGESVTFEHQVWLWSADQSDVRVEPAKQATLVEQMEAWQETQARGSEEFVPAPQPSRLQERVAFAAVSLGSVCGTVALVLTVLH